MENNVTTVETSERLKAAGFSQETAMCWIQLPSTDSPILMTRNANPHTTLDWYAAPTAQEIADQLPPIVVHHFANGAYSAREYPDYDPLYVKADTLAEVLAPLWIELAETRKAA